MNCPTLPQRSARSCATNIFWDTARVINHTTLGGERSRSNCAPPRDFHLSASTPKQATTRPASRLRQWQVQFFFESLRTTRRRSRQSQAGCGGQCSGLCRETAQWPSVIILNRDAAADIDVELDFGRDMSGTVQTETLHAPALDHREAHITTSTRTD
jgi:hypothetical protein